MNIANIAELRNNFSRIIRAVEGGEEVVVCRHNVPVARIVPVSRALGNRTRLGWATADGAVLDDLQGPFIPETDWSMH